MRFTSIYENSIEDVSEFEDIMDTYTFVVLDDMVEELSKIEEVEPVSGAGPA